MGTKITKQVLADRLAKKGTWTAAQVDAYVDAFFNVLHEGVTTEGIVKLKGLGTFKTIQVADRASVDVNTGERIVIPGHQKLKFIEEDKVNALLNNSEAAPTEKPQPIKEENTEPIKEEKQEPVIEEKQEPVKEEKVASLPHSGESEGASSKWWLWVLVALAVVLLVVGVVLFVNGGNTDKDTTTQTEQKDANKSSQPANPSPQYKIHSFQKGESLTTISVLYYGTPDSVERIQQLNGLSDSSEIVLGTELKLP